jgi:AGCS family alanine or glycine:cation symporter
VLATSLHRARSPRPKASSFPQGSGAAIIGLVAMLIAVASMARVRLSAAYIPPLGGFMLLSGLFFTLWFGFINVRGFRHAIRVVRGNYDQPDGPGEISHRHALTSALSGTIGLGSISGAALAVSTGGPGATIWMMVAAFLGMSLKFASCTLSQLYRCQLLDGSICGGPMYYLYFGLSELGRPRLGKALGMVYSVLIIGAALGGGDMFQANQVTERVTASFGLSGGYRLFIGYALAGAAAITAWGGIKRVGRASAKVLPLVCGLYLLAALMVLFLNLSRLPAAIAAIITGALSGDALRGGVLGVVTIAVQSATLTNQAGMGTESIAHAAATTDEPVREGLVGMLEPFLATVVVAGITGLLIVVSGAAGALSGMRGGEAAMTSFGATSSGFGYLLLMMVVLFAYSTMIAWFYYGERAWLYIASHVGLGHQSAIIFRYAFILCAVLGATHPLSSVLAFSDLAVMLLAVPNVLGCLLLAPRLSWCLDDYARRVGLR